MISTVVSLSQYWSSAPVHAMTAYGGAEVQLHSLNLGTSWTWAMFKPPLLYSWPNHNQYISTRVSVCSRLVWTLFMREKSLVPAKTWVTAWSSSPQPGHQSSMSHEMWRRLRKMWTHKVRSIISQHLTADKITSVRAPDIQFKIHSHFVEDILLKKGLKLFKTA
jgi:hypothetical protein